jgi:L-lactate dehydrogenase complex protein LldF
VKIPLHEMMLLLRKKKVEKFPDIFLWKGSMKLYSRIFQKRKRLEMVNGKMRNSLKRMVPDPMGKYKSTADFSPVSFSKLWKTQKR